MTLDVTISPLENDSQKYKVSIRHEGMSDSKQFVTLLDEMIQEDSEQAVFGLKRITLASLLKAHKVDFFDDFGAHTHKEWKLTDIINVTVNKDEKALMMKMMRLYQAKLMLLSPPDAFRELVVRF